MKKVIISCCLALIGNTTIAQAQSAKLFTFDPLISKLLRVKWISNHDPGFGGNNEFYKLSKELLKSGAPSDFRRMVNHPNPIVRAMGLLCMAQTASDDNVLLLLSHWKDEAVVDLKQGCLASKITIGEFAQRLLGNPHFLDP